MKRFKDKDNNDNKDFYLSTNFNRYIYIKIILYKYLIII